MGYSSNKYPVCLINILFVAEKSFLLWMVAKSESPVENGGLSLYSTGFQPLVVQHFAEINSMSVCQSLILNTPLETMV